MSPVRQARAPSQSRPVADLANRTRLFGSPFRWQVRTWGAGEGEAGLSLLRGLLGCASHRRHCGEAPRMAGPRAEGTSWLRAGVCAHSIMPPLRTAGSPWGSWRLGSRVHPGGGAGEWVGAQAGWGRPLCSEQSRVIPGADRGADSPGDQVTGVPGGSGQSDALWAGSDCTFACRKEAHSPGRGGRLPPQVQSHLQSWSWPLLSAEPATQPPFKNPASLLQRW